MQPVKEEKRKLLVRKWTKKPIYPLLVMLLTVSLCCGCGSEEAEAVSESVSGSDTSDSSSLSANHTDNDTVSGNMQEAGSDIDDRSDKEAVSGSFKEDDESDGETVPDGSGGSVPEEKVRREPVKVKGIYVSGPTAGIAKMDDLIDLVDRTELNAMVIDIKNDEGKVTYKMQSEQVLEIDAGVRYIPDIEELVAKCKEKDIYLIARIVAFRDPYLAEQKPEWAVHTKSGDIFRDKNGLAWINPYCREVWDYLVEIASQAALVGFDEVQFDYIRFSTDVNESDVDYGPEAESVDRVQIITEFTEYLYEKLVPQGVYVAADVFGTVIDNETDQIIVGQDYVQMAEYLDYICPMVYPSHYHNGSYGITVPDAEPYRTIYAAASASVQELNTVPEGKRAHVRMWLQSFTASWVPGHISYGPKQIRDQIKGAYDAGYDEWILWNAAVNYQTDAFLTEEEAEVERLRWDAEKSEAEAERLQRDAEKSEAEQIEEQESEESAMLQPSTE